MLVCDFAVRGLCPGAHGIQLQNTKTQLIGKHFDTRKTWGMQDPKAQVEATNEVRTALLNAALEVEIAACV